MDIKTTKAVDPQVLDDAIRPLYPSVFNGLSSVPSTELLILHLEDDISDADLNGIKAIVEAHEKGKG